MSAVIVMIVLFLDMVGFFKIFRKVDIKKDTQTATDACGEKGLGQFGYDYNGKPEFTCSYR